MRVFHGDVAGMPTIHFQQHPPIPASRTRLALGLVAGIALIAHTVTAQAACGGTTVEVNVTYQPGAVQIDDTKPSHSLETTGVRWNPTRQLGLTHLTPQRTVHIQVSEHDTCAPPRVTVEMTVRPLIVELARELNGNGCARDYVLSHELQHVAIYNATARDAAAALEREMRKNLTISRITLPGDRARELQRLVHDQWLPRLDQLMDQGNTAQAALDHAQEPQIANVCGGALAGIITGVR
jgi:hypothetical protein